MPAEGELRTLVQGQYDTYLPVVAKAAPQLHRELLARSGEVSTLSEEAFVDERTPHLGLTLPHSFNLLDRDVFRLRDALTGVDTFAQNADLRVTEAERELGRKADATATDAALHTLGQRVEQVAGGVPTLSDAVNSAASNMAASSLAVKTAYDKGVEGVNAAAAAQGTANAANTAAGNAQTAANEAKAAAQAAQGAIANVNPYKIGEFKSWFEQTPPVGWAVRNGQILYNADRDYPDLWTYLQQPANTWKCKTLAQWNALSSAAGGVGGVPFFVLDASAKTIKLPDTRGDYERDAGSSYLQAVGGWHGDAFQGHNHGVTFSGYTGSLTGPPTWIGYATEDNQGHSSYGFGGNPYRNGSAEAGGGSPRISTENRTRTYAILGCVYVRWT